MAIVVDAIRIPRQISGLGNTTDYHKRIKPSFNSINITKWKYRSLCFVEFIFWITSTMHNTAMETQLLSHSWLYLVYKDTTLKKLGFLENIKKLMPETGRTSSHSELLLVFQCLDSSQNMPALKEKCAGEWMDKFDQSGFSGGDSVPLMTAQK